MQKTAKSLEEVVKELPPDLQEEVRDFANFLLQKRHQKRGSFYVRIGEGH